MTNVVLDFETYFTTDYTLKKLPTSEYVRDSRFKAFGAAIKIDDKPTKWYKRSQFGRIFRQIDWSSTNLICHNADFDGLILSHHYNVVPKRYICTIAMARPLFGPNSRLDLDTVAQLCGFPPKEVDILDLKNVEKPDAAQWKLLEERAVGDVERTAAIYSRMVKGFPVSELDLIDMSIRAFADPRIMVDVKAVEQIRLEDEANRAALIKASGLDPVTLRSNDKFAAALLAAGINPPTKISPTTHKKVWAFAKTDLDFQAFQNDKETAKYFNARLAAKTTQTSSKTARLLKLGENGQRAPVMLRYCGAHTFRWSGGDKINFQNFKRGNALRRALTAPLGYMLSVVDLSQIEARVNAWLAGQTDLLTIFANGGDPYIAFAEIVWPHLKGTLTKDSPERFIGKVCVLALGYQMGAERLRRTLAQGTMGPPVFLSPVVCTELVQTYRTTTSAIRGQWKTLQALIPAMEPGSKEVYEYGPLEFSEGGVLMPNGLTMRYPALSRDSNNDYTYEVINPNTGQPRRTKIYGGLLTENVVQSLSRIIIGDHINAVSQKYRVVLTVHDEIVTLIPQKNAEEHHKWVHEQCLVARDWYKNIPLEAEGGYDRVYSK